MIRAYQGHAVGQNHRGAVAKPWPWCRQRPAILFVSREKRIESDLSQRDDYTNSFEQCDLSHEIRPAALEFNPSWFIIWRCASNGRGNVTIREFQTVIPMTGVRLIGESGGVKRSVKPVPAAIPGKYSASSISPVRRRSQAHNQYTGLGIAKAGQGLRPIGFTQVPPRRIASHLLTPAHEAGAFATNDYCLVKLFDFVHRLFNVLVAQRQIQRPCCFYIFVYISDSTCKRTP
jgi:hypothetical protein